MDAGHRDDALGRVQGGEIERPPPVHNAHRIDLAGESLRRRRSTSISKD
jgi:hypothetical protein